MQTNRLPGSRTDTKATRKSDHSQLIQPWLQNVQHCRTRCNGTHPYNRSSTNISQEGTVGSQDHSTYGAIFATGAQTGQSCSTPGPSGSTSSSSVQPDGSHCSTNTCLSSIDQIGGGTNGASGVVSVQSNGDKTSQVAKSPPSSTDDTSTDGQDGDGPAAAGSSAHQTFPPKARHSRGADFTKRYRGVSKLCAETREVVSDFRTIADAERDAGIRKHTLSRYIADSRELNGYVYEFVTLPRGDEWCACLGLPELEVSNWGYVRNATTRKPLSLVQRTRSSAYVKPGGSRYNVAVLVAMNFHLPPVGYDVDDLAVHHVDGDVSNNCADNLTWTTRKESGKITWNMLLANAKNTAVWQLELASMQQIALFRSASEAARKVLGSAVLQRNVRLCVAGQRNTCGGYAWQAAAPEDVERYLLSPDGFCKQAVYRNEEGDWVEWAAGYDGSSPNHLSLRSRLAKKRSRPSRYAGVAQLRADTNDLVREFDSLRQAARNAGVDVNTLQQAMEANTPIREHRYEHVTLPKRDGEEWCTCQDLPTCYQVSNLGYVRTRGRPLVTSHKLGVPYVQVQDASSGKRTKRAVARLVALTFVDVPDGDVDAATLEVAHVDGNVRNTRADNLRWVPRDLTKPRRMSLARAKQSAVWQVDLETGAKVAIFRTSTDAARAASGNESTARSIRLCASGKLTSSAGWGWLRASEGEVERYLGREDGSCLRDVEPVQSSPTPKSSAEASHSAQDPPSHKVPHLESLHRARYHAVWQLDAASLRPLAIYRSSATAGQLLFGNSKAGYNVRRCVNGQRDTAGGYVWRSATPAEVNAFLEDAPGHAAEYYQLQESDDAWNVQQWYELVQKQGESLIAKLQIPLEERPPPQSTAQGSTQNGVSVDGGQTSGQQADGLVGSTNGLEADTHAGGSRHSAIKGVGSSGSVSATGTSAVAKRRKVARRQWRSSHRSMAKAVRQVDVGTGATVGVFASAVAASRVLGRPALETGIRACVAGRQRSCGGYIWERAGPEDAGSLKPEVDYRRKEFARGFTGVVRPYKSAARKSVVKGRSVKVAVSEWRAAAAHRAGSPQKSRSLPYPLTWSTEDNIPHHQGSVNLHATSGQAHVADAEETDSLLYLGVPSLAGKSCSQLSKVQPGQSGCKAHSESVGSLVVGHREESNVWPQKWRANLHRLAAVGDATDSPPADHNAVDQALYTFMQPGPLMSSVVAQQIRLMDYDSDGKGLGLTLNNLPEGSTLLAQRVDSKAGVLLVEQVLEWKESAEKLARGGGYKRGVQR